MTALLMPAQSPMEVRPSHAEAKAYGAFYTDAQIADFLAWWGVRTVDETVFDPSFGGGVFLRAAAKRIAALGGDARHQVHGVELDPIVHRSISRKLEDEFGIPGASLRQSDFFRVQFAEDEKFSTILGNPPFIRYQRFTGESRAAALRMAATAGVKLSELSSSWAPFLAVSVALVRDGGRLAMVVPTEICHAAYARPILQLLERSFETVTFLSFEQPLFPDINESTMLLLGENRGAFRAEFRHRDFQNPGALAKLMEDEGGAIARTKPMDADHLLSQEGRFIEYLIPGKARDLYQELKASQSTTLLGAIADVGIGYVSGANDFFHVGPEEVARWRIPEKVLKPIIRRSRGLKGLTLTKGDWEEQLRTGESSYLLHLENRAPLAGGVAAYVQTGEAAGVHLGYKCRNRTPWYCVPHVHTPDAFLSYMSTRSPRLVFNDAGVFAPNTLHVLRFSNPDGSAARNLVSGWQTSLSRLSCELQGHALGGGMLKLEPTEAENAVLPRFSMPRETSFALANEIDGLLRAGKDKDAQTLADTAILRDKLNLSKADCATLGEAVEILQKRRL